jgi:hypothetical protein
MALDANRLGDAMRAAVDAATSGVAAADINRSAMFRALAAAIVAEIQLHAVVTVVVSTTGSASAQTGTGVGTPPTTGVL